MADRDLHTSIEGRLHRLETANRRLRLGLAVLGVCLLLGATQCQPPADLLQVRGLEVIDPEGLPRIRLAVTPRGPAIELLDSAGVTRLTLHDDHEETAIHLRDAVGTTRVGVAQFAHGGGGFALHGEASRGAAVLYLAGGVGSLRIFDAGGVVTSRFPDETAPR